MRNLLKSVFAMVLAFSVLLISGNISYANSYENSIAGVGTATGTGTSEKRLFAFASASFQIHSVKWNEKDFVAMGLGKALEKKSSGKPFIAVVDEYSNESNFVQNVDINFGGTQAFALEYPTICAELFLSPVLGKEYGEDTLIIHVGSREKEPNGKRFETRAEVPLRVGETIIIGGLDGKIPSNDTESTCIVIYPDCIAADRDVNAVK